MQVSLQKGRHTHYEGKNVEKRQLDAHRKLFFALWQ